MAIINPVVGRIRQPIAIGRIHFINIWPFKLIGMSSVLVLLAFVILSCVLMFSFVVVEDHVN
jgi:hypothetical protein